jgi:tRNA pseudouridine38-40 synthase
VQGGEAGRETGIADVKSHTPNPKSPRTLKLTIAYDGTNYVGWQRQAEGTSIQGLLEDALARFEGSAVTVHGAGRTDAGVHALGQVASAQVACGHETDALQRGLNACLPADVRVMRVEDAAPDFHARFSARSKTYRYVICNDAIGSPFERSYVWHVPEPLDLPAMRTAAAALIGTHDFAAFCSTGSEVKDTTRTITQSDIQPLVVGGCWLGANHEPPTANHRPGWFAYEVSANGFLRHMVRAIVGTLVEIGRGQRSAASIPALVAGRSRAAAGPTAPPHGLFLVRVFYD